MMRRTAPKRSTLTAGAWLCVGLLLGPELGWSQESTRESAGTPPSDATQFAEQYVQLALDQLRLEADAAAQQQIAERLETGGTSGEIASLLEQLKIADAEVAAALSQLLQENDDRLVQTLNQFTLALKQDETALTQQWRAVRNALNAERIQLFEVTASKRLTGQLAFALSVDNRWFWLFGLVAMGSLVGANLHDRRHEIRRRLNGGKARAMALSQILTAILAILILITAAIFIFGDRLFDLLLTASAGQESSPHVEFAQQNKAAAESLDKLRAAEPEGRKRYEKTLGEVKESLRRSAGSSVALVAQWEATLAAVKSTFAALQFQSQLTGRLKSDLAELAKLREDVHTTAKQTDGYRFRRQWICVGLGVCLLGLAGGGGLFFHRGVRRRREKISSTCPLCLGEGTFVLLDEEASGDYVGLNMVQCKNVISEQPFEECDFSFASMYLDVTKLCFPTLGIPQAGKTHWLAMVYRELNRGNYPDFVQFERIKSSSSREFDEVVDEILNRKIGPAATQTSRIPHPLVFNFLDRDRLGVSDILVNIFDYSGEVTRSKTLDDRQRQRALDGDGFFFFLDPTEPSETQAEALAAFREDLRRIKGVKAGGQIRTPVALCVSKIDMMVNKSYADSHGGGVIDNFYRDLGEIGWSMDLASMQARSQLLARLRDTVWPGWQIERQIHELFGGRYLFFPLTPVGLNGLGETDLARRTIAPVGLLDPLLWLLHMNGYPVLR